MDIDLKKMKLTMQPQVLASILNLTDDTNQSFKDLDRIIRADQNMAALIMKAANSSLYARETETRTLQHAIALLGFRVVRSLALMSGSKTIFEMGNYSRFRRLVWSHSVVTAIVSRKIASKYKDKNLEEESFMAGLLHDIGKVVLNILDRKKFIQVIDQATEHKVPFSQAETNVFGFNHLDLGDKLVTEWNLPAFYLPILCHHSDLKNYNHDGLPENDLRMFLIVCYANFLVKKYGYGHFSEWDNEDGELLHKRLQLTDQDIKYYEVELPRTLEKDEFYSFFMTMV